MTNAEQILRRLSRADRAHQREAGGRLLLRSVKYFCVAVVAAFVVDVVLHLEAGWRLGLLLALLGGAAALLAVGWYLAFVRRNRLEHIARFLESRDPALGSRLINLLQLRGQTADPALAPLTRELAGLAVEDYASRMGEAPFERLARTNALRREAGHAAWALLGLTALLAVFFRVTAVELARFTDPFGDHPPYSFTRLEIVEPGPAGTNVLYGKGFTVKVKTGGHQSKEVFITAHPPGHPEQSTTLPMFDKGRAGFDQMLDNIRTELVVYAHTKDRVSRSKQAHIGVVLTPQMEKAFVRIAPPAYTGLPAEEKPYAFQGVQALVGSEVRFRLQSNRPLREGMLEWSGGDQAPRLVALTNSAPNEVAGAFPAADSGRMRFSLVDVDAIPSQGSFEGGLTVTHDLPPEVRITEPERDAVVALDFKLQGQIEAGDDYGLRTLRLHRGVNGVYGEPKVMGYDTIVRDAHVIEEFNLPEMGVKPGDIVSFFAEAIDTAPEPHLARSQTIRFMVISVQDYNDLLRQETDLAETEAKYADLVAELEDLIEEQRRLSEAADKLEERLARADEKNRDALTRELDSLLAAQNELNEKLNQQAKRMETFVREDPVYDVERDLQEILREQAEAIRQSTAANNSTARQVATRSSPAQGGRKLSPDMAQDLEKAAEEQVKKLAGVREQTEEKVTETLQDMSQMQELLKDFNQFEALYQVQQELAAQTQAYNRAGQLGREDQLALKDLAAREKEVADALEQLQGRLRKHADEAEKLFPKAAQSGRDLADKIEEARLESLARQATGQMLGGNGERSFRLADRLRGEMEKLFSQCQGGNCPSSNELDNYLRLQRQMNPGQNFAQMARSRKPGSGQGQGMGWGIGMGSAGSSGYAVMGRNRLDVMGNERAPSRGSAAARRSSRDGQGTGLLAGDTGRPDSEKADALKGLNPVNRQSGAVASESGVDEYSDVVDSYFKAITTAKKP